MTDSVKDAPRTTLDGFKSLAPKSHSFVHSKETRTDGAKRYELLWWLPHIDPEQVETEESVYADREKFETARSDLRDRESCSAAFTDDSLCHFKESVKSVNDHHKGIISANIETGDTDDKHSLLMNVYDANNKVIVKFKSRVYSYLWDYQLESMKQVAIALRTISDHIAHCGCCLAMQTKWKEEAKKQYIHRQVIDILRWQEGILSEIREACYGQTRAG